MHHNSWGNRVDLWTDSRSLDLGEKFSFLDSIDLGEGCLASVGCCTRPCGSLGCLPLPSEELPWLPLLQHATLIPTW